MIRLYPMAQSSCYTLSELTKAGVSIGWQVKSRGTGAGVRPDSVDATVGTSPVATLIVIWGWTMKTAQSTSIVCMDLKCKESKKQTSKASSAPESYYKQTRHNTILFWVVLILPSATSWDSKIEFFFLKIWYFISKSQLGLRCSNPLMSSPGSHSLLVSDSVGITSSCSLLALPFSQPCVVASTLPLLLSIHL